MVISNPEGDLIIQLTGVAAYGLFAAVASATLWLFLKVTIGIRVSDENEYEGLDKAEIGVEAYPEFTR